MKVDYFEPVYVEFIPLNIEEGKLYISMRYGTATHMCPCGCQSKVVTPLGPSGWTMKFNGKISLSPSIGNYHLECNSHYFIEENQIIWVQMKFKDKLKDKQKGKRKKLKFKKRFPFLFLS